MFTNKELRRLAKARIRTNRAKSKKQRTPAGKVEFAAKMRAAPTSLEIILYDRIAAILVSRPHLHLKRQVIHCGFIVDAYIPEIHVAFEADGPLHKAGYDSWRDAILRRKAGIKVIPSQDFSQRLIPKTGTGTTP